MSAASFLRTSFQLPETIRNAPPDTLLLIVSYDSIGSFESLVLTSRANRMYDLVRDADAEFPAVALQFPDFDGWVVYEELRDQFVDRAPPGAKGTSLLPTTGSGLLPAPVSYECQPELKNADALLEFMAAVAARHSATLRSPRVTTFSLMVEPDGHVTNARIARTSGDSEIDIALLRIAELSFFEPAIFYGFPVRVMLSVPFTLTPTRAGISTRD